MTFTAFVIGWLLVLYHAVAWLTYAGLCAVVHYDRRADVEEQRLWLKGALWTLAWFWPITCSTVVLLVLRAEAEEDRDDLVVVSQDCDNPSSASCTCVVCRAAFPRGTRAGRKL